MRIRMMTAALAAATVTDRDARVGAGPLGLDRRARRRPRLPPGRPRRADPVSPNCAARARGRACVMRNFDRNRDGLISPREAEAANRAFAEVAGPRRDRFDWDARDVVVVDAARAAAGIAARCAAMASARPRAARR